MTDKAYAFKGKTSVLVDNNNNVEKFNYVQRSTASFDSAFQVGNNTSIRAPFSRQDYDRFRPNESTPVAFKDAIIACRDAYIRVGVVRNVIDMMTDFVTEDFKAVHPDRAVEAFLRVWIKKTGFINAIEEFARHILLDYNVVVKRTTAKVSKPVERQLTNDQAFAEPIKLYKEPSPVGSKEIPWRYSFLNIVALEWIPSPTGEKLLGFRPSSQIISAIKDGSNPLINSMVSKMPPDVVKNLKADETGIIPLDMDNIYVAHCKKDSWQDWSPPGLYSVLSDIKFKEKLKLSDVATADGTINAIRLWKLGDHVNGVYPTSAVTNKLAQALESNLGGGVIDIIWDSMIDMEPYYPPKDTLGPQKYEEVDKDILIGLGVPDVLIGGRGANFSNAFIQLKTLVEKLKRIRAIVTEWAVGEINLVCDGMGIETNPVVRFGQMGLEDKDVNRKMVLDLLDRGVISVEAVLDIYGEDFLLETERIPQENKMFKKIGIDVLSPLDPAQPSDSTGGGAGRPPKSKDVTIRKTRTPVPRTKGLLFAMEAIDFIDDNVLGVYIKELGVSNARKLTNEQRQEINDIRATVLASIKPNQTLDGTLMENIKPHQEILFIMIESIKEFTSQNGREPSLIELKRIEAISWANFYSGEYDG